MKKPVIIAITVSVLVVIFAFFFITLGNDPSKLPSTREGKPVPEFSASKLVEPGHIAEIITNEDIKGPALLNVWATWCPTCRDEHATLNVLKDQGVRIYGVNYKDDPEKAYEWLEELGNPYLFNFLDMSGAVGIELGVYGAPETYFIDQNNVIHYRHVGAILPEIWETQLKAIYEEIMQTGDPS
ncbi:DsbE family thiol:disulfide interchange protein [Wohlfahrtiimonas sp. G9077]|uniref:DsbE family thiol:disulfide interchange protein n=1 Tax=Wohlfahrtiimonas sp. G9077 TaxID=1980118 RepID=UPI000B98085A|nr:DsbE family thiol:disulfide interchange protein [Wohlfahrtiimonas sp. G9077]OYQ74474.1 thiol:disulfide interchange protein [Wohlfahrtiimonas sp. G9077]